MHEASISNPIRIDNNSGDLEFLSDAGEYLDVLSDYTLINEVPWSTLKFKAMNKLEKKRKTLRTQKYKESEDYLKLTLVE